MNSAPYTPNDSANNANIVLTQCSTSGATIVCPSGTFNGSVQWSDTSNGDSSVMKLLVRDLTSACPDQVFQIVSSTPTTTTLSGAPSYAISNTNNVELVE